ncbi:MAG: hypothetical protein ACJZ12_05465 [Candidatus Neomarinimicrobiota bacterium]
MKKLSKIILFPLIYFTLLSELTADIGYLPSTKDIKNPSYVGQSVSKWVTNHEYLSSTLAQAPNVSERIPSNILLEIPVNDGE